MRRQRAHNVTLDVLGAEEAGAAAASVAAHEAAHDHTKLHTQGTDAGLDTGGPNAVTAATITAHHANVSNPHAVTAAQAGADPAGTAAAAVATHEAAADPHTGYVKADGTRNITGNQVLAQKISVGHTVAPVAGIDLLATFGAQLRGTDVATDATKKSFGLSCRHYTNAQPAVTLLSQVCASGSNTLGIGGGHASLNAATSLVFYTGATTTTLNGTNRMSIDSAGAVTIVGALSVGSINEAAVAAHAEAVASNAEVSGSSFPATAGRTAPFFHTTFREWFSWDSGNSVWLGATLHHYTFGKVSATNDDYLFRAGTSSQAQSRGRLVPFDIAIVQITFNNNTILTSGNLRVRRSNSATNIASLALTGSVRTWDSGAIYAAFNKMTGADLDGGMTVYLDTLSSSSAQNEAVVWFRRRET